MEAAFCVLVGLFSAAGIYLMLAPGVVRIVIGIAIFGNAVNLLIFTAGRLTHSAPPIIAATGAPFAGPLTTANPLPQALILTAIVISFSMFAFLLVLAFRASQTLGTAEVDAMRLAEPAASVPPAGY